ncbi:MAG: hypothetical protein Q8Q03_01660 [bacterium]|nr:hypothetical protein [bacterium]
MISPPGIDLLYYFQNLSAYFSGQYPDFINAVRQIMGILIGISIPLSILLFIGIIICVESIKKIHAKEEEKYNTPVEPAFVDKRSEGDQEMASRWKRVVDHSDSPNESDWRQAIIEADIMLDDLLTKLGYRGEGIGEKLRRVERGDFKTLDQAGEAHGIRNRIAHDGSGFALNQIEARRVINLYRQVFEEFYHISG